MKIPFLPIHVFTQKRLDEFLSVLKQRTEKDNKLIGDLLRDRVLLEGSNKYLLGKLGKKEVRRLGFAAGADIVRNDTKKHSNLN